MGLRGRRGSRPDPDQRRHLRLCGHDARPHALPAKQRSRTCFRDPFRVRRAGPGRPASGCHSRNRPSWMGWSTRLLAPLLGRWLGAGGRCRLLQRSHHHAWDDGCSPRRRAARRCSSIPTLRFRGSLRSGRIRDDSGSTLTRHVQRHGGCGRLRLDLAGVRRLLREVSAAMGDEVDHLQALQRPGVATPK
jgi:hypothetical protein